MDYETAEEIKDLAWNTAEHAMAEYLAEQKYQDLRAKAMEEDSRISQILGKVLGYPWYYRDRKNFPNSTPEDGVCTGDLCAIDLAEQAARKIEELKEEVFELRMELRELLSEEGS